MSLTASQFRKGHRREMREDSKSLWYLLPLSRAIKVMDDKFGIGDTLHRQRLFHSGQSCRDSKATPGSWCLQGLGVAQAVKLSRLAQMVLLHAIYHLRVELFSTMQHTHRASWKEHRDVQRVCTSRLMQHGEAEVSLNCKS